jgi:hypothetical protein
MASRSVRTLCCIFTAFSGLAFAFDNTNTVPMDNGQRAKLIAVRALDQASRSASVVLDARDRYGTATRINATAHIDPSKFKNYVKQCLRGHLGCVAAVVITELLIQHGATIQPDGTVTLPGGVGGTHPRCVSKAVPWNADGGVVTAWGPMPCAIPAPNGNADLYTYEPTPQRITDTPQKLSGWTFGSATLAENRVYYRNPYWADRPEPMPQPKPQELTDEQLQEVLLKKPEVLQHAPGKYPDVWKSIPVPAAAKDSDIGTTPTDPDQPPKDPSDPNNPDNEQPADMIGLSDVPTLSIDVSKYLTNGTGWLPKQCPQPVVIPFFSRSLEWDYTLTCDVTSSYISAFVMIGAVLMFLRILVGGLNNV